MTFRKRWNCLNKNGGQSSYILIKAGDMSKNSTNCVECRLASGGGLVLSSIYMFYCGKKYQNFNRYVIFGLGSGIGILGLLRIFDFPPFRHKIDQMQETKGDTIDQDNYIVGKLPTKFP